MNKFSTFLVTFLTLTLVFAFAGNVKPLKKGMPDELLPVRQAFMEKSPGSFDAAQYMKNQQETFDWLMAEAAALSPESIVTVRVTKEDLAGIENYQCETCGAGAATRKDRIGVVKPVGVDVAFHQLKPGLYSRGMMEAMPEGGYVWTTVLESPTATALRVHFSNFSLSPNAEVYIYNMNGEAFGPYTDLGPGNEGDFWSNTVTGSIAYVQLRHFGPPSINDLKSTHFTIGDIGYLGDKFLLPFMQQVRDYSGDINRALTHCPGNEDCVEDASCYSGTAINNAKKAAAHMQWVAGSWIYYCSGGLIADTDTGSQIPYFLTANHCMSKGKDAKALECYFQYWTANCGGACYDPVGVCPRTLGADILDSSRNGDHTLMQLWENPPSGSYFMGWTTDPMAYADGTHLFRISHPSGEAQAYSEHIVDSEYIECGTLPIGEFIYSKDVVGATEGGSSGSPVMNMSGQIVGQLYGACGYTLEICDFEENRTVDGAFAFYFDSVKPWLDPGGGPVGDKMHVDSIVLSIKVKGPKTDAIAKVTIVDENNNPVSGADVTGTFSGDANGTTSDTTDASGIATLKINVQGSVTTFTFCVDTVTHATYTYDSAANVETCDTY
jgi:hypothetical protein